MKRLYFFACLFQDIRLLCLLLYSLVGYLKNHQCWGKSWQLVSVLLNNGYILPNMLATVSPSPYIKISPKGKNTISVTAEQEDLTNRHRFSWILWPSFMSFQNLFKSWESQNVLAYEVFFGTETKKKKKQNKKNPNKTTLNLSFHWLSPCANVNLHQPFP